MKKVITILALLIISAGCYASQEGQAKEYEKKEIEFCWKTVKDQDKDFAREIMTATCESMIDDFKKKYGVNP